MADIAATTIFALSSGMPPAAIAVIRISGPQALTIGAAIAGTLPAPRVAAVRRLRDGHGTTLDQALVLVFDGPATATGEDLVELHLHGGRAVIDAVSTQVRTLGAVPAEPGAFTRRAFQNGRIDLNEADALGDLLAAETESQRRAAISGLEGGVSRLVDRWTDDVLGMSAAIEAAIDFSDEDDVPVAEDAIAPVRTRAAELSDAISRVLDQPPVERLFDGIRVVLAGPRNAGKSTLLNALVGRDVAIVSPIAGTTRDRIEAPVSRNGRAYVFTDTAGLVDTTDDPVEAMGIDLSRTSMATADILLWLGNGSAPPLEVATITVATKADLGAHCADAQVSVSATTGAGLNTLWARIDEAATILLPRLDQPLVNRRQREHLARCRDALRSVPSEHDPLLIAEHLRQARRALDANSGRAGTEAMLDQLFGRFCIGK